LPNDAPANPKTAEAYYQLGNLYVKQNNYSQAQFCYEKELAINPLHVEAHCHLGVVYANQKQLDKAIESFRKALAINENHVNALCNLGNTYIDKNDLPLALIYLEKAFSLDDQHIDTLNNLGLLHKNKNKLSEAIACYKKAIAVDCYYANAHFNLAFVSLLSGDYELGWQEYEWRFQANKQLTPEQQFPNCKQWQGEKLTNKTLLIYAEQGFGDAIQFIRYVILVAQSVDNIIVQCLTPLHRLFHSIPQISQLVGFDQPLPHFDVYYPLMSLPFLFHTDAETIPANVPYLHAPKSAGFPLSVNKNKLNVGLVWVGNPAFKNDKNRSIDISNFQPITLLKQVQFYSLQVGNRRSDLSQITFANPVIEIGDKVKDFADTAAIIEQLDLVISVDTSVAHLAGALNKPVWILLPFSPDFRWLLEREDCPWYPSVRLFRQREAGVWHDVFNRIKQTLENEVLIHFSKENANIDTPLAINTETVTATGFDISIASDNAFKYHQAGQLDQAKQLYQQILVVDKNNMTILHYLGLVLHQLGETEQAINYIKKAIAVNPEYIAAYNNLGIIYMEKNQLDEAIDCYQQVIALNSNYAPAYYNMGSAYQRKQDLTHAMACYQQALSLNPNYAEAHYNLGIIYQKTDEDTAISCYETALSIQPDYAQAHYNLGTIYLKQQNYEQAISHYQAALAILPNYVEAQCYLGHAYLKQKDFTNAMTHYEKTLVMQADYVDAICGLGSVHLGQNQLELAIESYEKALTIHPNCTEAQCNLGLVYIQQNKLELALACYQKTLQIDNNYIDAYCGLGDIYFEQDQFELAIESYEKALVISPNHIKTQYNLGRVYFKQKKLESALICYQKVLQIDKNNTVGLSGLGSVYLEQSQFELAIEYYKKSLAVDENQAYPLCCLGFIYLKQDQLELAIEYYEKAIVIDTDDKKSYLQLGFLFYIVANPVQAIFYYKKAIALDADYADAHMNMAFAQLLNGDYEQGWQEHEWRWQVGELNFPKMMFAIEKKWQGEHLAGKTILLYAEQGLGDVIQFIRYVSLIADYGAAIIIRCQPTLKSLFVGLPNVRQIITDKENLPYFDFHSSLMSLPWVFKTRLQTIPAQVPYLFANKKLSFDLPLNKNTLNIGFVWAGNSQHLNNKNRSIAITHFQVFSQIKAVQFYSLQVGESNKDLNQLQFVNPIIEVGSQVKDFAETAAIINKLDLIICVDTSVAHLAGALNKPTWLLLPFAPDWRWLLEREDSPWYPSFRLFRQTQRGDWSPVFQRLKYELEQLVDK
jgi:tetratricopeptide (TPR) repeat protein